MWGWGGWGVTWVEEDERKNESDRRKRPRDAWK